MTQPAPRLFGATLATLFLATVCLILVGLVSPASAHPGTIHVKSGQSIQAVIDRADCGDRILVEAGNYTEQLTIAKDGVTLIGLGAILTPPAAPTTNICSGLAGNDTQAGICVTGSGVVLADFEVEHRKVLSVVQRVKDVSVTGFEIHGFSGENIAVVGAKNACVTGNKLVDGGQYGALTVGSKNTRIAGNTVSSGSLLFIGICMDDVADVEVSNNTVSGYFTGLCIQTAGAEVRGNEVSGACFAAFVDPGVHGAKIRHNHIGASAVTGCAPTFADGITLSGAVDTHVRHNLVEGQRDAGIAIVDDATGAIASGNVVARNILRSNGVDLFLSSNGTGNVFRHNTCSTSSPLGLCA